MSHIEYLGEGSLAKCADILADIKPRKVFLVIGTGSYSASGAKAYFDKELVGMEVLEYSDFHAVLIHEDVQKGVVVCKQFAPDLVIGVGGGHVLDTAKAINFYAARKPLIAVPTTAGSGAEATPFAVVYKDGLKTSLEDPALLPTYAIVDPVLSFSAPKLVALASGLDALSQAIESYGARGATDESRTYATQALALVWPNLERAIKGGDKKAMVAVSLGAHLSGKAIAISKTTACHAFSYGLTYRFGVPHGIAVAVFLPAVMRLNKVELPLGVTPEVVEDLLKQLPVPKMSHYGVGEEDIPKLVAEINVERLSNNPRKLTQADSIMLYKSVI